MLFTARCFLMVSAKAARITRRQLDILRQLHEKGHPSEVRSVKVSQHELAGDLKITRQALSNHLRKLRDAGLVRTGRRFIDITSDGIRVLGEEQGDAFVFIKVAPQLRRSSYDNIRKTGVARIFRVTGEIDLIAMVRRADLESFLHKIAKIEGVKETSSHVVLEPLK